MSQSDSGREVYGLPPHLSHWIEEFELTWHPVMGRDDVLVHARNAMQTGFPELELPWPHGDRPISILGSGPSIADTWMNRIGDTMAVNDAVRFLAGKAVLPTFCMVWDPQELVVHCIGQPQTGIIYLVASMCHPKVFEHLRGYDVRIWHPRLGAVDIAKEVGSKWPGIGGGTVAAVPRGAQLAYHMGYRVMHLHGMDSSTANGSVHFEDCRHLPGYEYGHMDVWCGGRRFVTTPQMYQQAKLFKPFMKRMNELCESVKVHGDGLVPHIARLKGWHVNSVH